MNKSIRFSQMKIKNVIMLFIALIVLSFGVSMYLKAGLGTDSITTMVEGVSVKLNISVGHASQLSMSIVLVGIFILDRRKIGLGTFVNGLLTGVLLNFFMGVIENPSNLFQRGVMLAVGVVFFGVGLALFILSDLGEGPVDSIMSIIMEKFNFGVEKSRFILDASLVLIGYSLGAPIGIGTILGVSLTGTIIAHTINIYYHLEDRWCSKIDGGRSLDTNDKIYEK